MKEERLLNWFIELVLNELRQGIGQAIAVVGITLAVIAWAYFMHKRKYGGENPFPWKKTAGIVLFAGYLAVVNYATLMRGSWGGVGSMSLHLFRAWREAWNNFSVTAWLNILLNIAMFMPLGILLPLVWKRCRKWYRMLGAGFGLSLWIELMQYVSGRGVLDVDDLFTNTLGAMLGFFLLMAVLRLLDKRWRGALGYGAMLMIPVATICGIFVLYEMQAYGNLPDANTYRVDTSGVKWSLSCELPDVPETVSIYKLEKPTQEDADTLRDLFARVLGVEFERTDYYDESTMYMDQMGDGPSANFLTVRRLDGSYDYALVGDNTLCPTETDRETIEAALAAFGITVPEQAEFTYLHSGQHSFTADRLLDGSVMVTGELKCQYNEGGILSKIENNLIVYEYYGEESILSPAEAYEKLKNGEFGDSGRFERADPGSLMVKSCRLDYQVDTKGFCQPVYLFVLAGGNSEYSETVMISAIR